MKKIFYTLLTLCAIVSCKGEFDPVFTGRYKNPKAYEYVAADDFDKITTIADLAKKYTAHGSPFEMTGGLVISGRVSTTDQPGNFYKSLYIQDETGGMEIKIGQNGLTNNYLEGQEIFIDCDGLYLGEYGYKSGAKNGNGMVQIGFDGTGTDYETSYLENKLLVDTHIYRGNPADIQKVQAKTLTEGQLPDQNATLATCPYLGKMVTVEGLQYGWTNAYDEHETAFVLMYINSQKDKKASANRIFISGDGTGVDRWGLSKERMDTYLTSGMWDDVQIGNANDYNYGCVGDKQYKNLYLLDRGDELQEAAVKVLQAAVPAGCVAKINSAYKDTYRGTEEVKTEEVTLEGGETVTLSYVESYPGIERAAYSVSQYFTVPGSKSLGLQIRTSGYGKFADALMDEGIFDGTKTVTVTGILTLYQGKIQVTVNRLNDITVK